MNGSWKIARLNKLDKKTGVFEVYCLEMDRYLQGHLKDLINTTIKVNDKVRILIEKTDYSLRIRMLVRAN